jgi:hypothetical protein
LAAEDSPDTHHQTDESRFIHIDYSMGIQGLKILLRKLMTRRMTSLTFSWTAIFSPLERVMMVSGVSSIKTIRSGFITKGVLFKRVTAIMNRDLPSLFLLSVSESGNLNHKDSALHPQNQLKMRNQAFKKK